VIEASIFATIVVLLLAISYGGWLTFLRLAIAAGIAFGLFMIDTLWEVPDVFNRPLGYVSLHDIVVSLLKGGVILSGVGVLAWWLVQTWHSGLARYRQDKCQLPEQSWWPPGPDGEREWHRTERERWERKREMHGPWRPRDWRANRLPDELATPHPYPRPKAPVGRRLPDADASSEGHTGE
jgi:hypothetical protein